MGEVSRGIDGPGRSPHAGDDDANKDQPFEGGGQPTVLPHQEIQKDVEGPAATEQKAVATPCRAPAQQETPSPATSTGTKSSDFEVPDLGDISSPAPTPQKLRISEAAADARLRRTMAPSLKDGSFKVSSEVIKQYRKGGKGKKSVLKLLETCGYCQDWFSGRGFSNNVAYTKLSNRCSNLIVNVPRLFRTSHLYETKFDTQFFLAGHVHSRG